MSVESTQCVIYNLQLQATVLLHTRCSTPCFRTGILKEPEMYSVNHSPTTQHTTPTQPGQSCEPLPFAALPVNPTPFDVVTAKNKIFGGKARRQQNQRGTSHPAQMCGCSMQACGCYRGGVHCLCVGFRREVLTTFDWGKCKN